MSKEQQNMETKNMPIEQEFERVKGIIYLHRERALQTVNNENLLTAWEIGAFVSEKLKTALWGSKTVTQLSEYLRTQDPTLKGYGRSNIYYMVDFYNKYSSPQFISLLTNLKLPEQFVQFEIGQTKKNIIVQSKIGQSKFQFNMVPMPDILSCISWTNHIVILNNCNMEEQRLFYILYSQRERLYAKDLQRAISTDTYSTLLSSSQNQSAGMKKKYPQAKYLFKDKIFLDFLGLPQYHSEKKLQSGLVTHIKDFILELGKDFFFIGNEYPINVGGEIFKIDLLFFNRALQCFVAIELKATKFKPADMGQLEFYLEALDQDVKRSNENPSIGILLCKESNQNVVKYALNRCMSPTMVAKYEKELIEQNVLQRCLDEFCQFLENE